MQAAWSRRIALLLAFAVPFAVYACSSFTDVTYWDVGELDTVPWIFGIAHPTGFPAYVVLGWAFAHIVPLGSVAFRMSLFSALGVSVAAYCVAHVVSDAAEHPWLGMATAWFFAFGAAVWAHATRAEAHALATGAYAVMIAHAYAWYRNGAPRSLYCAAAAFGVGLAMHPILALALPGILILVVARLHETPSRALLFATAIAIGSAGVWYLYLPLRSAYVTAHALDPNAAVGAASGGAFWDYDHPASPSGFLMLTTGSEFDLASGTSGITAAQTYRHGVPRYLRDAAREWTLAGVALVLIGIIRLGRRDPAWVLTLLVWAGVPTLFALGYVDESDPSRYELPSFVIASIFAGSAWAGLRYRAARVVAPLIVAVCALALVSQGGALFAQPRDTRARDEIVEIERHTPANAVLIASWVLAPALAYESYVAHGLGDRVVDSAWFGEARDVLPRWIRRRPVYVVGTPEGSVPGFRLERIATQTELYRVIPEATR